MATSLVAKKVFSFLTTQSPVQLALRAKSHKRIRIKHRKAPKPWNDPRDQSWAAPILRYTERRAAIESSSEPEAEPSVLHMVYRIKDMRTRPYWEKDMLRELELYDKPYTPVVVKNTPEMNEKLRVVKHLVRVKAVTFPYGLPRDPQDYKHCYLTQDGEFIVKHRIDDQSAEVQQAWAEVKMVEDNPEKSSVWTMTEDTIRKDCLRTKQMFRLNDEYFPEQYHYKYNQDGREDRYTGDHNIGRRRQPWY